MAESRKSRNYLVFFGLNPPVYLFRNNIFTAIQLASPHYIWTILIAGSITSIAAVQLPVNNSPVTDVTSNDITCNVSPGEATETVDVPAGSTLDFKLDNTIYHQGPATIYLGKAPSDAASWDGSGANWFKIVEWGATFNPFGLSDEGVPQWYISCTQINITGGGSASPSKVSIPGYVSPNDPGLTVDDPVPTTYIVPGPAVFSG
ncbi:glycoside hydrolase family 61 [Pyrrhoderma noxium]|uniref:AA9 family lytic polysaccharide monooxygenase n=1 Tax=Pyrrhoderma noxium TaxID=2282107 RepID=A0A286U966_9AGAM|nr:glycoside hydrolase family 61 [Pyrrhoderma noxium]